MPQTRIAIVTAGSGGIGSSAARRRAAEEAAKAVVSGVVVLLAMAVPQSASAQQAEGQRLFQQRCASCHSLEDGRRGSVPSLFGIVGRTAGSLEGARYSQAMESSGLVWDRETLDRFLADPRGSVPGTSMPMGVADQAQRAAIITYLESAGDDT